MKRIDKLSMWLKSTVQGGDSAPLEVKKPAPAAAPTQRPQNQKPQGPRPQRPGGKSFHKKPNHKQGDRGSGHARPHRGPVAHGPRQNRGKPAASNAPSGPVRVHQKVMRIIPIGGLEEVGKNCMIVEYEDDIVVIDMGFQFPEEDMLGVDYVIPDIRYLVERKNRIRGILVTHGHLDHIGALPY
ncbi:MAG: MBL fold metallo-hydrolase, partial [Patescibacteria group bacterium]